MTGHRFQFISRVLGRVVGDRPPRSSCDKNAGPDVQRSTPSDFRDIPGQRPNFLGIGAAKAGTTTLARQLSGHPEISFSRKGKELHFFDEQPITPESVAHYFSLFPSNIAVGEFTPSYLFDPKCRDQIRDVLGTETRFIAILRNPVDRAYSHYLSCRAQLE